MLEDFFLSIEAPSEPEVVIESVDFQLVGYTRIDATVSVNDTFVDVDENGRFALTLDLIEGPNVIEVVVSVESGEELAEILVIIVSP